MTHDTDTTLIALRSALKSQYHAALAMLRFAIEQCPDELWAGGGYINPTWRVAYHTLFYTHFYLQPTANDLTPWEHHVENINFFRAPADVPPITFAGAFSITIPDPSPKAELPVASAESKWKFDELLQHLTRHPATKSSGTKGAPRAETIEKGVVRSPARSSLMK